MINNSQTGFAGTSVAIRSTYIYASVHLNLRSSPVVEAFDPPSRVQIALQSVKGERDGCQSFVDIMSLSDKVGGTEGEASFRPASRDMNIVRRHYWAIDSGGVLGLLAA